MLRNYECNRIPFNVSLQIKPPVYETQCIDWCKLFSSCHEPPPGPVGTSWRSSPTVLSQRCICEAEAAASPVCCCETDEMT